MENLKGRVAIVTGASSGIGKAIAFLLAKNNVKVTLIGRREDKLNEIAAELADLGLQALVIKADLSDEAEVVKAFKVSHTHWGRSDILINSAGICSSSNFHSGNTSDWKNMWDVNVFAVCVAIQEALKYFNHETGGQIINISSTSSFRVGKPGSFYAATKFALRAITESLRQELVSIGSKTRVSSISPGFVATSFGREGHKIPDNDNKEMLDTEDIANAVLHVLQTPAHVAVCDIILRSSKQLA
ncbi:MAG: Short-chain dehydrogenase/reductase [Burkholderiales bacterium]|jgi:NADP-dependent 3-hydroxy acid dehydrogenase YdfG|nr:Short-chain dehydrogenase/reductase [Burkholderiales bacterium]